MKAGINNYFGYVKIVAKNKLEQPGSPDSAKLNLVGVIEKKTTRGTVTSIKKVHIPLEVRGRTALIMDSKVHINDHTWVIGELDEFSFVDIHGDEQHKLLVRVVYFDRDREFDIKALFKDE